MRSEVALLAWESGAPLDLPMMLKPGSVPGAESTRTDVSSA